MSCIVTKEAFRRLVAEGLVASRERLGTFVRDTNEKRWRGRVIFVYDADETGYFQTALAERIRPPIPGLTQGEADLEAIRQMCALPH